MKKTSPKTGYRLNRGFITQKVGNKTTIFAGEESLLFTLNETASYIFNGIKLGWDKKKIVSKLIERYTIEKQQAEKDIEEFTNRLVGKNILLPIK